jgi:hypothetical protein
MQPWLVDPRSKRWHVSSLLRVGKHEAYLSRSRCGDRQCVANHSLRRDRHKYGVSSPTNKWDIDDSTLVASSGMAPEVCHCSRHQFGNALPQANQAREIRHCAEAVPTRGSTPDPVKVPEKGAEPPPGSPTGSDAEVR